ncbi:MAG: peptidase M28 [Blastocatellia bacterium AA13]|nr:MAG: peptidase M28 [Blastocatellia bacterium AA13]
MKQFLLRRAVAIAAIASIALPVGASNLPLPAPEATAAITARDLKRHLSFLASDELGGRYTLSSGNRIAARYIASQLEFYGFHGAARDGSFFQKVPIVTQKIDSGSTGLTIASGETKQSFKYADDFISSAPRDAALTGELIFVGQGISSPRTGRDDYAGLDVTNKIVVLAAPDERAQAKYETAEKGEGAAIKHGAAAVILTPSSAFLSAWSQIKFYESREQTGLDRRSVHGKSVPALLAGPPLIKSLAALLGKEAGYLTNPSAKPPEPLKLAARADIKMKVEAKPNPQAQNVAGILEGADPKLKNEYVVFSAHYDHLETTPKGEVYNGADDDGSGTVSVLEIAHALAVGPRPKRSILVVFHTGEEMGLLGSEYNTDYEPVVPLEKLVADFNIDMVGRSRTVDNLDVRDKELTDKDSLYIIGADKLSTELNKLSEQTNADTSRMRFDLTYNDENHPQHFYYRSDHYNYAKHGIPIIFYFTGVHRDYHRTTDDVDKIDFEKMERIDRMIFATGWRVANLDHRLVVDKKPAPAPQ